MKPRSIRHLLLAWGALLVLLALTLGSAFVPMGPWNGVVNYAVAFAKATIVMIVFMHATCSGGFVRLLALTGLVWLLIMGTLGLSDYGTRGPPNRAQSRLSAGTLPSSVRRAETPPRSLTVLYFARERPLGSSRGGLRRSV